MKTIAIVLTISACRGQQMVDNGGTKVEKSEVTTEERFIFGAI